MTIGLFIEKWESFSCRDILFERFVSFATRERFADVALERQASSIKQQVDGK